MLVGGQSITVCVMFNVCAQNTQCEMTAKRLHFPNLHLRKPSEEYDLFKNADLLALLAVKRFPLELLEHARPTLYQRFLLHVYMPIYCIHLNFSELLQAKLKS